MPSSAKRDYFVRFALGIAYACGIHSMRAGAAEKFEVLHAFKNDTQAAVPFGSVFDNEGWLYGTTVYNQSSGSQPPTGIGMGTVYRLRHDGTHFQVLKQFSSTTDGGYLFQGLIVDSGMITGVAKNGGQYGYGTLFSLATDGSDFTVLHHFGATGDGRHPYSAPVAVGDTLFGLSFEGGTTNAGVLYSFDMTSSTYAVRRSFTNPGGLPFGSLTPVGEWLYGMVSDHGLLNSHGAVFRYRPRDDTYQVIHTFTGGSQGGYPYDSLTWDGDNFVYGTTLGYYPFTNEPGPLADEGVIFRINIDTNDYEVIHDFRLAAGDGAKPNSAMLIGPDGWLYGISHGAENWGGEGYEFGTLYRLLPDGADFEVLHTFDSLENGNTPMRSIQWIDGYIYGTTAFGGEGAGVGNGTVWRFAVVPEPAAMSHACVALAVIALVRMLHTAKCSLTSPASPLSSEHIQNICPNLSLPGPSNRLELDRAASRFVGCEVTVRTPGNSNGTDCLATRASTRAIASS